MTRDYPGFKDITIEGKSVDEALREIVREELARACISAGLDVKLGQFAAPPPPKSEDWRKIAEGLYRVATRTFNPLNERERHAVQAYDAAVKEAEK